MTNAEDRMDLERQQLKGCTFKEDGFQLVDWVFFFNL